VLEHEAHQRGQIQAATAREVAGLDAVGVAEGGRVKVLDRSASRELARHLFFGGHLKTYTNQRVMRIILPLLA
jgi:hypothetical protein